MESIIWLGFHRVYDGVLFNVEGWFPSLFQFTFLFSQCVRIMTAFGIYQLSFSIQSETWINLSADVTPYTSLAPGWFTSDEDVILGHFTQNYFSTFISSFFSALYFSSWRRNSVQHILISTWKFQTEDRVLPLLARPSICFWFNERFKLKKNKIKLSLK